VDDPLVSALMSLMSNDVGKVRVLRAVSSPPLEST
jgi:hypothetical protein